MPAKPNSQKSKSWLFAKCEGILVYNRKGYVTVEIRNHGDQQMSQGSISSASSEAEIWPEKREKHCRKNTYI